MSYVFIIILVKRQRYVLFNGVQSSSGLFNFSTQNLKIYHGRRIFKKNRKYRPRHYFTSLLVHDHAFFFLLFQNKKVHNKIDIPNKVSMLKKKRQIQDSQDGKLVSLLHHVMVLTWSKSHHINDMCDCLKNKIKLRSG